jgi:hypothetical protein
VAASLLVNIIAVILALFARKKDSKWLKRAFFVIFIFLAIRYGYGNDYMEYLRYFIEVNRNVYGFSDYLSNLFYYGDYTGERDIEKGWLFLSHLFQPLGFFAMVAVLSGIYCYAYYKIINEYVPPAYYWLSVFIFVFDPSNLLIQASAMRQTAGIIIFIFAFYYLLNKNVLRYGVNVYLATLFHNSSIVLFPVYYLVKLYKKITIQNSVIVIILYVIFILFSFWLLPYIYIFNADYLGKYSGYEDSKNALNSGMGMVFMGLILIAFLYTGARERSASLLFIKLAIIAILISAIGTGNVMISRIGYYFGFSLIVAIPIMVYNIKNNLLKPGIMISYMLLKFYGWYNFFYSPVWFKYYYEYHTIFSSPKIF